MSATFAVFADLVADQGASRGATDRAGSAAEQGVAGDATQHRAGANAHLLIGRDVEQPASPMRLTAAAVSRSLDFMMNHLYDDVAKQATRL